MPPWADSTAPPLVLLVATHWTPCFENCRRSLHQQGYQYRLLGWGQPWRGWRWRIELYLTALRDLPPDTLVVLLDAYDALAARPAAELRATFDAFDRPVVVGAEWYCGSATNCGRVQRWWHESGVAPSLNRHVNAGCVVGAAGALERVYTWIDAKRYSDDQRGLSAWVDAAGPEAVALDVGAALVQNVHVLDGLSTGKTTPAFFQHFPGPLLKRGLFPHYNVAVRHLLGVHARPAYPTIEIDAILFALTFAAVAWFILRH